MKRSPDGLAVSRSAQCTVNAALWLLCWYHCTTPGVGVSAARVLRERVETPAIHATATLQIYRDASTNPSKGPVGPGAVLGASDTLPHCKAGVLEWDSKLGHAAERACRPPATHWSHLAGCLSHKKIAFVGDSHVRNAFRCFVESASANAEALTDGTYVPTIQQQPGHYPFALQPEEANECTNKTAWCPPQRLFEISLTPNASLTRISTADMEWHWPTCANQKQTHNHDYHVVLQREGTSTLDLWFFWNPLDSGGEGPGDEATLQYAGPRSRHILLRTLHEHGFDLVITGALEYNSGGYTGHDHKYLYEYFHHRGMLLNHRAHWWTEGQAEFELSQRHGIMTVDSGQNQTDYFGHLHESDLRVQAQLLGIGLQRYFPCSLR